MKRINQVFPQSKHTSSANAPLITFEYSSSDEEMIMNDHVHKPTAKKIVEEPSIKHELMPKIEGKRKYYNKKEDGIRNLKRRKIDEVNTQTSIKTCDTDFKGSPMQDDIEIQNSPKKLVQNTLSAATMKQIAMIKSS